MAQKQSGLWTSSDAYERYMGRWSRRVAPQFLDWLAVGADQRWLDIGCGTGGLSAAILGKCSPRRVSGIDPSDAFVATARSMIANRAFDCSTGNAEALPYEDNEFDVAVSGLVLNFVSDKDKAIAEMIRVVRPGGLVALYVWDYAGHMQFMRHFFDAAIAIDRRAREFDDGEKAPICRPGPLSKLLTEHGLAGVAIQGIDIPTAFTNFEDYWTPFLGGTGSAPKYLATLEPAAQVRLREQVRKRLPTGPDGEILLAARAWGAKGTMPAG